MPVHWVNLCQSILSLASRCERYFWSPMKAQLMLNGHRVGRLTAGLIEKKWVRIYLLKSFQSAGQ